MHALRALLRVEKLRVEKHSLLTPSGIDENSHRFQPVAAASRKKRGFGSHTDSSTVESVWAASESNYCETT